MSIFLKIAFIFMIHKVMGQDFWNKLEDEMNKNREHTCIANCFNLGGAKPGVSRTQPDCIIDVRSISSDCDDIVTKNMIPITQTDSGRYTVSKEKKNWHEASRWCRVNGLQLVSIETQQEHQQLMEKVFFNITEQLWIGGCDHVADNQWYWVETGEDMLDYKYWDSGEPNIAAVKKDTLRCTYMKSGTYKWAVDDCMTERKCVCEMPELCFKQYCNTNS